MPVDPEVRVAVEAAGLTVLAPVDDGLGHDGGLIVEAPLHNSAVRALAQRPGFSVSPSGLDHSVVWRQAWRNPAQAPAPAAVAGPPGRRCRRCGGDLADHILSAARDGLDEYLCLVDELSDVIADLETSDPPAEPGWVEILRGVEAAYKRSLVNVEGPVVVTRGQHLAEVTATDDALRDAAEGWVSGTELGAQMASTVRGDTATTFAALRDMADAEPLAEVYGTGAAFGAVVGHRCVMCGNRADDTADGRVDPFPHLVSCPWARAVEIVGRQAPPDDVVDAEIYCGHFLDDNGARMECERIDGHAPPHRCGRVTWALLPEGVDLDG
jgi:hypothetical protein